MISICYGTNLPNTISSSEINIIVTISNCRQTLYSSCGGLISVTSHSMHCAKTDAFQSYMHIGKFLEQDSKAAISHYTECWCTRVHEAMHRVHRVCMEMQVHAHAHVCISGQWPGCRYSACSFGAQRKRSNQNIGTGRGN